MDSKGFELLLAAKILGKGGGSPTPPVLIDKTITENGTYNAVDDEADGYKKVITDVPNTYTAADEGKVVYNAALELQTAYPSTISENGTYTTTNNNSVTVDVQSNLTTKNITANGTYNASADSADGYSSVTVNVPQSTSTMNVQMNFNGESVGGAVLVPDNVLSVELSIDMTSIPAYLLGNTTSLTEFTIPERITEIGDGAFYGSGITSLLIPDGISFGNDVFASSDLETVEFLGSSYSFQNESAIFANCQSLTTALNVPSVAGMFNGCYNLTTVTINQNETYLSDMLTGLPIISVEIPASVQDIYYDTDNNYGAFTDCYNLETITIHKPSGSISGAPWGAPNTTTVVWDG